MLAVKEMKDPVLNAIGMKRLTGQALTYAFFPLAAMSRFCIVWFRKRKNNSYERNTSNVVRR